MPKVIEVIYEDGVLKPLQRLDLPENTRLLITIREKGILTQEFLKELKEKLRKSKKIDISHKKIDEMFHEEKMFH